MCNSQRSCRLVRRRCKKEISRIEAVCEVESVPSEDEAYPQGENSSFSLINELLLLAAMYHSRGRTTEAEEVYLCVKELKESALAIAEEL
jgi:hypothetical protein